MKIEEIKSTSHSQEEIILIELMNLELISYEEYMLAQKYLETRKE